MPKFSILTPTFNHEKYIGHLIESVLSQDFTDYELIIVDDASSDNALSVINSYVDSKIKLIVHDFNKGINAALNTAFENSSGEYMIFCAGDDMLEDNALSNINKILDEGGGGKIIAIYSMLNVIDEHNEIIDVIGHTCNSDCIEALHKIFLISNCLTSPGLTIKREYFAKMYPLPLAMCNHQDTYMHANLFLNTNCEGIYFTQKKFIRYRRSINHKSLSHASRSTTIREYFEIDSLMQSYLNYFLKSKNISLLKRIFFKEINKTKIMPYENTIEFFLGRIALESREFCRQFWGYHTIMNFYNKYSNLEILKDKYNFTFKDFLSLSSLYKKDLEEAKKDENYELEIARFRKKHKKYKKLFNIALIICVVLFGLNLSYILG